MSKLYNLYLKEKLKDNKKLYLFECGAFYIFIDEDAIKISSITTLKLIKLINNIKKCGFPVDSLDKYLSIFSNLNLDIKIINTDKKDNYDFVINRIKNLDINSITPIESFNILREIKDMI